MNKLNQSLSFNIFSLNGLIILFGSVINWFICKNLHPLLSGYITIGFIICYVIFFLIAYITFLLEKIFNLKIKNNYLLINSTVIIIRYFGAIISLIAICASIVFIIFCSIK